MAKNGEMAKFWWNDEMAKSGEIARSGEMAKKGYNRENLGNLR